jgi:hypothetical protein
VKEFPPALGAKGFMPKQLHKAMQQLGVPKEKSKALANDIALRIHEGIFQVLTARKKLIREQKQQKKFYKHFVLGVSQPDILKLIQQSTHPPAQPAVPEADTSVDELSIEDIIGLGLD